MPAIHATALDLTPPRFVEGLADWSRGDGAAEAPSCEGWSAARIVCGDPLLGDCLEIRMTRREERLRYMGELPVRPGSAVEIRLRLRALAGPLPRARVAARPGGGAGRILADLPARGPLADLPADGAAVELRLVVSTTPGPRIDLVWNARALYAHVGLDLVGRPGGVVRIADIAACEIIPPSFPGFEVGL
ncbi:hypothetical protein [Amaricoccus sp.]|uniref:hypothetical protein n=1 Tax=Amaricoccus sp. TaxID=1872485 RepID=UPI001B613C07|nr:hypothetical protein [Amaricoccus sp.]MBP7240401.1 hypothetical protein [Amaricoccus sp.]